MLKVRCIVLCCAQLWNRQVDTKCLMAWNDNLVVLSFRGTASMRNVLADVKVCWQTRDDMINLSTTEWHMHIAWQQVLRSKLTSMPSLTRLQRVLRGAVSVAS
jgi:hypothetical protein